MLGDERAKRAGKLVLGGELEPFANVVADDLRACPRTKDVVRVVSPRLILDEVLWSRDLADVVVVRADAGKQGIGADGAACGFGEIGDRDRVGVGPRCLETQPL